MTDRAERESYKGPWNVGNENLPFHPSASHVPPEYRNAFNNGYWAAVARSQGAAPVEGGEDAALPPLPAQGERCDDCPPVGYPTDKTRCLPCDRRGAIPQEPKPVDTVEKCYSFNGEDYTQDFESVIQDMQENEALVAGNHYHEATVKSFNPSDFLSKDEAENILERMSESAFEECGENIGNWPVPGEDKKAELQRLLVDWVDKNVTCHFFLAKNPQEIEITAEDVAEWKD